MTARAQIVIYGAGGFAREVAWLIQSCAPQRVLDVACFVDDDPARHGEQMNGLHVLGLQEARHNYPHAKMVAAVGDPRGRRVVVEKAVAAGFEFDTIVQPGVQRSKWIEIGSGTVICAGCILTTNIVIGEHVQVNLDCTVGHDVVMESYATLAPGVHVSGNVHIGSGAYIGTGAVMINGHPGRPLVIGEGSVVGAGACVTKSLPAGVTVVGVPARAL